MRKIGSIGYGNTPLIRGNSGRFRDFGYQNTSLSFPEKLTNKSLGTAPSDAIVLFDGGNLDNWGQVVPDDENSVYFPQWRVEAGAMTIVPETGHLRTLDTYGDCQLHLEWAAPAEITGDSQQRGDSGVLMMGLYEIQILDSFDNRTFADGQAGAIYGQHPPQVNASRRSGQWQTFDIVFEAPRFAGDKLEKPAFMTP
ncbi:MAG: DUF1080 domain-containing protein [Pirellulaceae bacterium]